MTDGESRMHALIGAAFVAEPALPDVDDALDRIMALGQGIRTRHRIRTGVAAAVLCVSGFGMIAGIAAIAHSNGRRRGDLPRRREQRRRTGPGTVEHVPRAVTDAPHRARL